MTSPHHWRLRLTWLLFGALGVLLCLHLRVHWMENPQYSFGILVPALAGYALYRRWLLRPAPGSPPAFAWKWCAFPLAFLFLPLWLVAQPNPDWRLVSWLLTADLLAFALLSWTATGGVAWLRHFAFPTCFLATAVPWPSGLEAPIIQGLMHFVAGLTVAALNLAGMPALQHGNVIEIGTGLLGVDEACSGVRSLQATLMAALFLGELYGFRWPRRFWLLGAGLGVAIATNAARAFFLAWQASRQGLGAVDRWHDPAGYTVMTACFVALWLIAVAMRPGLPEPAAASDPPPARLLPLSTLLALLGWFALVLAGTEAWFRSSGPPPGKQWTFRWPKEQTGFQKLPIAPETAAQLRYDYGEGAAWKDATGAPWLAYHFQWASGPSRSRLLARMHRPENCLPATGWQMTRSGGTLLVEAGGLSVPFQALTFEQGGEMAHIWYCTWEDLPAGIPQRQHSATSAQRAGLDAVLRRQRNLGQQVLQVVRFGPLPAEEADAAFRLHITPLLEGVHERH